MRKLKQREAINLLKSTQLSFIHWIIEFIAHLQGAHQGADTGCPQMSLVYSLVQVCWRKHLWRWVRLFVVWKCMMGAQNKKQLMGPEGVVEGSTEEGTSALDLGLTTKKKYYVQRWERNMKWYRIVKKPWGLCVWARGEKIEKMGCQEVIWERLIGIRL